MLIFALIKTKLTRFIIQRVEWITTCISAPIFFKILTIVKIIIYVVHVFFNSHNHAETDR